MYLGCMDTEALKQNLATQCRAAKAWLLRDEHRAQARELRRAFTEHPQETGETYLQHLWFTLGMSARFIFTTLVLLTHGLFPFLLTRSASRQIEEIYRIMKTRIPQSRRNVIDADSNE